MYRWIAVWAAVVVVGMAVGAEPGPDPKQCIEGDWRVVSVTVDGEGVPAEKVKNPRVVFTKDMMITLRPGDKTYQANYKLDPKATPRAFDLTRDGKAAPGIYQLNGESLTICLPQAGAARPKLFEAKKGSGQMVVTLERVKE